MEDITVIFNQCECSSYSLTKPDDITITYGDLQEQTYTLSLPACLDEQTGNECVSSAAWIFEAAQGENFDPLSEDDYSISTNFFTVFPPVLPVSVAQVTSIYLKVTPAAPENFVTAIEL